MELKFSNPRLVAEFDDWPSGGNRVKCKFELTQKKNKWRVERTTTNKYGIWNKPKLATYALQGVIVDGSDGKTYIIQRNEYGFVSITTSDLMQHSTVHDTNPTLFAEMNAIIDQVHVNNCSGR